MSKRKKFKGTQWSKKYSFAAQNEGNVHDCLLSITQSKAEHLRQNSGDCVYNLALKTTSAHRLSKHEVVEESFDVINPDTSYQFVNLACIKQVFQGCHWVIQSDEQSRQKFRPDGEEFWCSYKSTGKNVKTKVTILIPFSHSFSYQNLRD